MKMYDEIISKDIYELAEWLDKYGVFDNSPWIEWWDKHYCQKCESEFVYVPQFGKESECSYCELNHKCKFFPDMDDEPSVKDIIIMWLESDGD